MLDAIEILSIIGVALGGFSTIAVCCLGQKPFKDFIYDYFINMRWSCLFRCWHNEMIYKEILNNQTLDLPSNNSDKALLRVILSWDPTSPTLPLLCKAIEMRHSGNIFPVYLISRCADTINISETYYIAWKVIDLMNSRIKQNIGSDNVWHLSDTISKISKHIKNITENMPEFIVDINETIPKGKETYQREIMVKIIDKNILSFKESMHKGQSKELLDVLGYMLNFLRNLVSLNCNVESPTKQNDIFGVATQIRIKLLSKINGKIYNNFIDETLLLNSFFPPNFSVDNDVQWVIKCRL